MRQGRAYLQANRVPAAIESFKRVIKWLPTHRDANLQLAYLYLHTPDYARALQHCQRVLESEPKNLTAWAQRLEILDRMADKVGVEAARSQAQDLGLPLERLERIGKSLAVPPQKRIQALVDILKLGNLVHTEIAARLFIENYPEHPLGWQVLGEVLHNAGHLNDALAVKLQTVNMFSRDANVYNNLARTYLALKDYDHALESANKALAIDPNHQMAALHRRMAEQEMVHTE